MLGKKLYRTGTLNVLRLVILAVLIFFLNDFILETFTYDKFQEVGRLKILDVINYHYRYPYEAMTFFVVIIVPCFYYGLVRGTRFYEKGFCYNRGLPFMNKTILYSDIKSYKLLHPKYGLSLRTQDGTLYLIADNTIERVIAILDQHNIQGDLAPDDFVVLITSLKNFIVALTSVIVVVFLIKKFGVLFR